jgi:hypothetical protein
MYVKEGDTHRHNHRYGHQSDHKSGNKEERTAEFTEDTDHQRHVASKTEDARIIVDQEIEVHHLIQAMNEKQHTEHKAHCKNQKRRSLSSELMRE